MIEPKVFRVADANEPVITPPMIGVDDGLDADTPANNGLERLSLDIRNDLGKHFSVSFVDAEDDGFATSSAAPFAFDPFGPEVAFIDFYLTGKRSLSVLFFGQTLTNFQINLIDRFM